MRDRPHARGRSDLPEGEEIPVQRFAQRRKAVPAEDHGGVDNVKDVLDGGCVLGDVKRPVELGRGTDAEDVDDGGDKEPEKPAFYAAVGRNGLLGLGLVFGPGLVLADGRGVHDGLLVVVPGVSDMPGVEIAVETGLEGRTVFGAEEERVVGIAGNLVGARVARKFQHWPDAQKINKGKQHQQPQGPGDAAVFWLRGVGLRRYLFCGLTSHWKIVAHEENPGRGDLTAN